VLVLPKSLRIVRSEKQEQKLVEQTRAWLKNDHRDPRIHASDLLDPTLGGECLAASCRAEHAYGGALLRRESAPRVLPLCVEW